MFSFLMVDELSITAPKEIKSHYEIRENKKNPNDITIEAMKRVDSNSELKSFTLDEMETFLDEYKSR
jgi:hypothetical protein